VEVGVACCWVVVSAVYWGIDATASWGVVGVGIYVLGIVAVAIGWIIGVRGSRGS